MFERFQHRMDGAFNVREKHGHAVIGRLLKREMTVDVVSMTMDRKTAVERQVLVSMGSMKVKRLFDDELIRHGYGEVGWRWEAA
jgi:hypothetical protein